MLPSCPHCGLKFDRGEPGYYLGAIWFNLLFAEAVTLAIVTTIVVRAWPDPPWDTLQIMAPIEALVTPFLFFPFSKTLFLAFDLGMRPLSEDDFVGITPSR